MSVVGGRAPCIVGVAQRTVRPGEGPAPEPFDLWADVCTATGVPLAGADSLQVVYCMSWPYDDPVGRLAERLGIDPRHRLYSGIGGTTPQVLMNEAAEAIERGDIDMAVIAGAEALETKRQAKKAGERLPWSHRHPEPPPFPFEAPFHPAEIAHEVFQAWLTFPVFDVARRARLDVAPDAYRRHIAELLAPMSEVAAENPYAWFPTARSADELASATPENRMVGYPYTKYEISVMDVDMAAALVLCSDERADALGIPPEQRVYLRGWAYAEDPTYLAEHPDLAASPAMASASAAALTMAGVGIDDVAHLDLYSCFASSVHLACDALGLAVDDPRGFTVTGGLAFAGGAGSNYMLHSIATMVDVLRRDPGSVGLVSGVGMHMTKHVYGVYSTEPGRRQESPGAVPAPETVPIIDRHEGPATIASYTVAHGRGGDAEWGLAICDVDGGRAYGRIDDVDLLAAMESGEWVGRTVELAAGDKGVNLVRGS